MLGKAVKVHTALTALGALLFLGSMACGGGNRFCVAASEFIPPVPTVQPAKASLFGGQTQLFQAIDQSGSTAAITWSVLPPTGGTIDATGLFTATGMPGTYTIQATKGTVTATGLATILPTPPPVITMPNSVQASGTHQDSVTGSLHLDAYLEEPLLAVQTQDASGFLHLRPGFIPQAIPGQ